MTKSTTSSSSISKPSFKPSSKPSSKASSSDKNNTSSASKKNNSSKNKNKKPIHKKSTTATTTAPKPLPALPSKPADVSANWKALLSTLPPPTKAEIVKREKRTRESEARKEQELSRKKLALDDSNHETLTLSTANHKFVKDPANLIIGSFTGPTKYIALDCEMVGVGENGERSALGRVSVVNYFGHVLYDKFVKAQERITDFRTRWSGIRPSDLVNAVEFSEAQKEVADLLKGRKLVAHSVENDLQALLLSHPKHDVIDTSLFRPFRKFSKGKTPGLKTLSRALLGLNIQSGEHSSVEDARATMAIFRKFQQQWDKLKNLRPTEVEQLRRANKLKREKKGSAASGADASSSFKSTNKKPFDDDKDDDDDDDDDDNNNSVDYETWTEQNPQAAAEKLKYEASQVSYTLESVLELLGTDSNDNNGNEDEEDENDNENGFNNRKKGNSVAKKSMNVDDSDSDDDDNNDDDNDDSEEDDDDDDDDDDDPRKIKSVSLNINTTKKSSVALVTQKKASSKQQQLNTSTKSFSGTACSTVPTGVIQSKKSSTTSMSAASNAIISQFIEASKKSGFSATISRGGLTDVNRQSTQRFTQKGNRR